MSKQEEVLDLSRTYIQLRDGPDAIPIPVGKDFWEKIAERTDLGEGRLVMISGAAEDWKHWEMHPVGEEVLYLLSGALDLVLQHGSEPTRTVQLRSSTAFIVPRGNWHRAIVRSPYVMLSITYGAGTQHRPSA